MLADLRPAGVDGSRVERVLVRPLPFFFFFGNWRESSRVAVARGGEAEAAGGEAGSGGCWRGSGKRRLLAGKREAEAAGAASSTRSVSALSA